MKKLLSYFMQGLVLMAPLAITIYIIFVIFSFVDHLLRSFLSASLGINVLPGLGIIFIFIFLVLLGYSTQYFVTNPFRKYGEKLLSRAPLVKVIYSSLVDLFSAFAGKEKKFNHPVKVCINKENNLWKIGFVTHESMSELSMPGLVAVYFPHSYNFSGELYVVATGTVFPLTISPSEAMKFIISGGVTRVEEPKQGPTPD